MTLRDYMQILRRRWKLVIGCFAAVFGITVLLNFAVFPKEYTGSAQLLITGGKTVGPFQGLQVIGVSGQRVQSYASLATSLDVSRAAVRVGNLKTPPEVLQGRIAASVPTNTQLVDLQVSDPTPRGAQHATSAVATALSRQIADLEKTTRGRTFPILAKVASHPSVPASPSSPATTRNLTFGFFFGLAVGIAAAILGEVFDTRVRNVGALTERFGLVSLGVIENDSLIKKTPLVVRAAPQSHLGESFRQLRTNLRFVQGQRDRVSVAVTSAQPNEGKSTITANLALALAIAGESVILLEADLRRPKLGSYLNANGGRGLSELLTAQAELRDVVLTWTPTGLPSQGGKLWLIPAGTIPPNPSEILDSQSMADLLADLKREANVVLIDTPPVLAFADAPATCRLADTTLFVVRAGQARFNRVARALTALDTVGASVGGVVLNMAPRRGPDADYAYDGYPSYNGAGESPATVVSEPVAREAKEPGFER